MLEGCKRLEQEGFSQKFFFTYMIKLKQNKRPDSQNSGNADLPGKRIVQIHYIDVLSTWKNANQ